MVFRALWSVLRTVFRTQQTHARAARSGEQVLGLHRAQELRDPPHGAGRGVRQVLQRRHGRGEVLERAQRPRRPVDLNRVWAVLRGVEQQGLPWVCVVRVVRRVP